VRVALRHLHRTISKASIAFCDGNACARRADSVVTPHAPPPRETRSGRRGNECTRVPPATQDPRHASRSALCRCALERQLKGSRIAAPPSRQLDTCFPRTCARAWHMYHTCASQTNQVELNPRPAVHEGTLDILASPSNTASHVPAAAYPRVV
jgi:hypothetical protein